MLFLQISRHSIESCPFTNEKVKKIYIDFYAKYDQLMKKHGIKLVGGWSGMPGSHFNVVVVDAPNMDALMKFSMEPVVMSAGLVQTIEIYPVMTLEETMKLVPK